MFLIFLILWILFNGRITLEVVAVGAVVSAALYFFICRFMGYSFRKDIWFAKQIGRALHFFLVLVSEIVKANGRMIGQIYSRKKPDPCLVRFTVPLKTEVARVLLANCITLTPGTITCSQEGNTFVVHCLDASMAEGIDESVFVNLLEEWEEEQEKNKERNKKEKEEKEERDGT